MIAGIMRRRHRLERLEGTTYDATDVEVSSSVPPTIIYPLTPDDANSDRLR